MLRVEIIKNSCKVMLSGEELIGFRSILFGESDAAIAPFLSG